MSRVLIFDLDGTLIDSRADLASSGNQARRSIGLPALPLEQVVGYVGDGLDRLIERLVPAPALQPAAKVAFWAHYLEHCCDATRPYDGIVPALTQLQAAGWQLAVATNKPGIFTRLILQGCGLAGFFTAVEGGDGPRKPAPGQLQAILRACAGELARSWMIGDHHTDIRAGRAAGCRVLFCTWGMGHADGETVDASADRPDELPGILQP